MEADGPEGTLRLGQVRLEQVRLENEKLKLELSELKTVKPWYHKLTQMVPMITAIVALAGFLWGVVQYRDQNTKNRETQEREFMKPWLESQRQIYSQALSAVATIANSADPEEQKGATEQFWRLYQGKMIPVETMSVSGAMVRFGRCLDGSETCGPDKMNSRCRVLGTAMAESMAATAKMTFSQFVENQFRYGPQEN